ncbi:MAG: toll/interleukin-1 receptor domain-containing protein [Gammaproteobacteria bacterium]|nr:toll/interleukin-1 receptor domain-containing protein [Gammaproteobacteria bacterium]
MRRYTAFISYSHSDARFAKALQHDLEKFHVPQPVTERLGRDNNRLGSVFRDVSDLGAAARLTEALTTALANSQVLIVVCSPAAAKSDWVRQEILEFQRIRGEDATILPVVAPQAGDLAAEAYFPAALGETPPLAADARRSADGRRGALLKLVAGLLGTGLDELIQRDARRRQRRLVAGVALSEA